MNQERQSRRKQSGKLGPERLRSINLTVRVTRAEFDALDDDAIARQTSMSELIRQRIFEPTAQT